MKELFNVGNLKFPKIQKRIFSLTNNSKVYFFHTSSYACRCFSYFFLFDALIFQFLLSFLHYECRFCFSASFEGITMSSTQQLNAKMLAIQLKNSKPPPKAFIHFFLFMSQRKWEKWDEKKKFLCFYFCWH